MALSPSSILSTADMENFANEYLGLHGVDADLFYEAYYDLDNESCEKEYIKDELNQTDWEYWLSYDLKTPYLTGGLFLCRV